MITWLVIGKWTLENDLATDEETTSSTIGGNKTRRILMNQLMVTPQENFQWTQALKGKSNTPNANPIFTFPLRTHKGVDSQFTDWLTEQLTQGRQRITKPTIQAVKCIAVNLACAMNLGTDTGFVYSLGKRLKAIPKRFRREPYSRDTMNTLLAQGEQLGLIKIERGFKSENYTSGIPSLILPTETCINQARLLEAHEVTDISVPIDPLILRNNPYDYVNYSDEPSTLRMRKSIMEHNEVRTSYNWVYTSEDNRTIQLSQSDLSCRRIFKGQWCIGGRFYCDAQNLPQVVRSNITINGEPCVELDYKSMHPRLLYHLSGAEAPSDCYDIEGVTRDKVKKIALIATSTSSKNQAVRAVSFHLKVNAKKAGSLLGMFEARHKAISDLLYRNAWQTLQNIDSKIANDVMDSLTQEAIPVIPVHDSFIVPESKAHQLRQAMHEQYEINTGMEASIA